MKRLWELINFKKLRFVLLSALLIAFAYFMYENLLLVGFITVVSVLFVQYLDGGVKDLKSALFVVVTPILLVLGLALFFTYYPNLSIILKLGAGSFYFGLLYTLLLLNNVLLVVKGREEIIPVYSVAVNWVQIVLLGTSLSLFTGLLRLGIQPLLQALAIITVSLIFYQYAIWVWSYEKDSRQLKTFEALVLSISFAVLTGWSAFSTLFFSAESFLRGIFVASVFLLGLGYIQLYIKNALSKKTLQDYLVICLLFLVLLVVFKP